MSLFLEASLAPQLPLNALRALFLSLEGRGQDEGWASGGSVVAMLRSQSSLESRPCAHHTDEQAEGQEVKRHSRWADQWALGRGSAATPTDPMRYRERGPPKVTEGQVGDQDTCVLEQGTEAAHSGPGDSGVCLPS